MKRQEIINLSKALMLGTLKAKPLCTNSFVKLLNLKKRLSEKMKEFGDVEQALMEAYSMRADQNGLFILEDGKDYTEFFSKLKEVQKDESDGKQNDHVIEPLNFINDSEFKDFCGDTDLESIVFISEYLRER